MQSRRQRWVSLYSTHRTNSSPGERCFARAREIGLRQVISEMTGPDSKQPRAMHPSDIRFLREQDGESERLLKARLVESFRNRDEVQRAYLAQISSDNQSGVALCLRTRHGPDPNIVREVGAIFARLFVKQEHLDILFLSEAQESVLRNICNPFYLASAPIRPLRRILRRFGMARNT